MWREPENRKRDGRGAGCFRSRGDSQGKLVLGLGARAARGSDQTTRSAPKGHDGESGAHFQCQLGGDGRRADAAMHDGRVGGLISNLCAAPERAGASGLKHVSTASGGRKAQFHQAQGTKLCGVRGETLRVVFEDDGKAVPAPQRRQRGQALVRARQCRCAVILQAAWRRHIACKWTAVIREGDRWARVLRRAEARARLAAREVEERERRARPRAQEVTTW